MTDRIPLEEKNFSHDKDMNCLSLDLTNFEKESDATPYDAYYRAEQQILQDAEKAQRLDEEIEICNKKECVRDIEVLSVLQQIRDGKK